MKIVLHEFRARIPYSVLTALVTASSISHASIIEDGCIFDTNIERGYFDERKESVEDKEPERIVTIFNLQNIDSKDWINKNIGKPYNKVGLFLWPFNLRSNSNMYCFEAVEYCLREYGLDVNNNKKAISGGKILDSLTDFGYLGTVMQTHQMYSRLRNKEL